MHVTDEDKRLAMDLADKMERVYVKAGHTRANIAEAEGWSVATAELHR